MFRLFEILDHTKRPSSIDGRSTRRYTEYEINRITGYVARHIENLIKGWTKESEITLENASQVKFIIG